MATSVKVPETHTALVFHSTSEPLELVVRAVPKPTPGTAVVRVRCAGVVSYTSEVYSGKRVYPYPTPFVPGFAAVGHIAALGPGATVLQVGDLVYADVVLRGRDDPTVIALRGLHQGGSEASARLVQDEFRDGTYAEYAKVPLENLLKLPETMDYTPQNWVQMGRALVPFGGLTNDGGLDLRPGETVVVAPATGQFGGAAAEVALAMGGRVVALGRSEEGLQRLKKGLSDYGDRLRIVKMTGDVESDTKAVGPVDCYFDISPPAAAKSTHIKSCFLALKPRGRVCLMGGIHDDVAIPHGKVYRQNITITGKWMYEQGALRKILQMVEAGLLRLNRAAINAYPLTQWKSAFDNAALRMRWDEGTVLTP